MSRKINQAGEWFPAVADKAHALLLLWYTSRATNIRKSRLHSAPESTATSSLNSNQNLHNIKVEESVPPQRKHEYPCYPHRLPPVDLCSVPSVRKHQIPSANPPSVQISQNLTNDRLVPTWLSSAPGDVSLILACRLDEWEGWTGIL